MQQRRDTETKAMRDESDAEKMKDRREDIQRNQSQALEIHTRDKEVREEKRNEAD